MYCLQEPWSELSEKVRGSDTAARGVHTPPSELTDGQSVRDSPSTDYAHWDTGRECGARMDGGMADNFAGKVFSYFPSQAISELRHLHRNEKTPVHTKQTLGCTKETDFGEMNRIIKSQESVF